MKEKLETSLFLASLNRHDAAAKLFLVDEGVDPESKDEKGRTPLIS